MRVLTSPLRLTNLSSVLSVRRDTWLTINITVTRTEEAGNSRHKSRQIAKTILEPKRISVRPEHLLVPGVAVSVMAARGELGLLCTPVTYGGSWSNGCFPHRRYEDNLCLWPKRCDSEAPVLLRGAAKCVMDGRAPWWLLACWGFLVRRLQWARW